MLSTSTNTNSSGASPKKNGYIGEFLGDFYHFRPLYIIPRGMEWNQVAWTLAVLAWRWDF